jgi:hypothetical protein
VGRVKYDIVCSSFMGLTRARARHWCLEGRNSEDSDQLHPILGDERSMSSHLIDNQLVVDWTSDWTHNGMFRG